MGDATDAVIAKFPLSQGQNNAKIVARASVAVQKSASFSRRVRYADF
jgi:hypothetical protein